MLRAVYANMLRPTKLRLQTFIESTATPEARPLLRQDPWRLIVQQYVEGTIGFAKPMSAVRPVVSDLRRLASAEFPVLVIEGREESLHDGVKAAARYRRQLPNARVELVDDANHVIPVDQPQIVDELLADFLG
jgi:pimeloyl-ACP methyl ester carboxylesterase